MKKFVQKLEIKFKKKKREQKEFAVLEKIGLIGENLEKKNKKSKNQSTRWGSFCYPPSRNSGRHRLRLPVHYGAKKH